MLRKMFVGLVILFLTMQGVAPASASAGAEDGSDGRPARVNVDTLNLRAGAGTEYAIVRSLTRGSLLGVLEEQGEWSRVRTEDGTVGWVASKYIAPVLSGGTVGGSITDQPPTGGAAGATGVVPSMGSGDGRSGGSKAGALAKWGCLAGGVLVGLFVLQQFVLGGDHDNQGGAELPLRAVPVTWDARYREVRATLVRARF